MNEPVSAEQSQRRWVVCGMLLLALVLNYMDRQTLSLTITAIEKEIQLTNTQYGLLEKGFGYAFAVGGLVFGVLADRLNVRWLYPTVLLGWSIAGLATGYADRLGAWLLPLFPSHTADPSVSFENSSAYLGFMCCRVALGFFEAGQWPCALVTTQRLLSQADRSFGNSILQSGASIGAILTPFVVGYFASDVPGWWRAPYVVIGSMGVLWIVPWFAAVWGINLSRPTSDAIQHEAARATPLEISPLMVRRYLALVVVVIGINLTWQYFRVWLPKMMEQYHGYDPKHVRWFVIAYYIATDLGCIAAGASVKWLAARGTNVHRARMMTFAVCAALTALSTVASQLHKGPWLLLTFLVIGFGALGLFPNYYSFTQEMSKRHQGKVSGSLGFITWVVTSKMQELVGREIDRTHKYADGIFWIGLVPLLGLLAMLLLWGTSASPEEKLQEQRA